MILSFLNICKVPREMLKTSGFTLGFQHLPRARGFQHLQRDLANVNEWQIMFDPCSKKIDQTLVKLMLHLRKMTKLKWKSDKN